MALTEDSKGEIAGRPDMAVVSVQAGKHCLIIGIVGDGISEDDASVGRFIGNFGQLFTIITSYHQGDCGVHNFSVCFFNSASEGEVCPGAEGLVPDAQTWVLSAAFNTLFGLAPVSYTHLTLPTKRIV